MGIKEKIESAKSTGWISEGMDEAEIKTTVELAKISAKIEKYRRNMGMTQKEFADYMGVTQGMVSKWESREYNFTIKSINEICQKIGFSFSLCMEKTLTKSDYTIMAWDKELIAKKPRDNKWIKNWNMGEAIA